MKKGDFVQWLMERCLQQIYRSWLTGKGIGPDEPIEHRPPLSSIPAATAESAGCGGTSESIRWIMCVATAEVMQYFAPSPRGPWIQPGTLMLSSNASRCPEGIFVKILAPKSFM